MALLTVYLDLNLLTCIHSKANQLSPRQLLTRPKAPLMDAPLSQLLAEHAPSRSGFIYTICSNASLGGAMRGGGQSSQSD